MEQEGNDAAEKVVVRSGSSACPHCHKRLLHRHQSMENHLRICHPNETPVASSPSTSSTSSTTSTTSSSTLSQSHDSSTSTTSSRKRKGLASSAPTPSKINHIVINVEEEDEEGEKEKRLEVGEEEEERLVPLRAARKGTKRARTSSSRKDKTTINVAINTTTLLTPAQTTSTAPQNLRIREDEPRATAPTTTPTSTTRPNARRSAETRGTEDGTPHLAHLSLFDELFQGLTVFYFTLFPFIFASQPKIQPRPACLERDRCWIRRCAPSAATAWRRKTPRVSTSTSTNASPAPCSSRSATPTTPTELLLLLRRLRLIPRLTSSLLPLQLPCRPPRSVSIRCQMREAQAESPRPLP